MFFKKWLGFCLTTKSNKVIVLLIFVSMVLWVEEVANTDPFQA